MCGLCLLQNKCLDLCVCVCVCVCVYVCVAKTFVTDSKWIQ